MPRSVLAIAAVVLAATACQTMDMDSDTDSGTTSRTMTMAVLGPRNWHDIAVANSHWSLTGDGNPILRLEANDVPDRRQERARLADGSSLFFEQRHVGGYHVPNDMQAYLMRIYKADPARFTATAPVTDLRHNGALIHFLVHGPNRSCAVFMVEGRTPHFAGSWNGNFNAVISGVHCLRGSGHDAALTRALFGLADRIAFDDGAWSRAHGARPGRTALGPALYSRIIVPVSVTWANGGKPMLGSMTDDPAGGVLLFKVPATGTECRGTVAGSAAKPAGPWSLSCSDGTAAHGTAASDRKYHGTGQGRDKDGNPVTVTFGG